MSPRALVGLSGLGLVLGVVISVAGGTAARGAVGGPGAQGSTNPAVRSARLRQRGRLLFWTVTLEQPLRTAQLADGRRSVCLLLTGTARGGRKLCLAATHGGALALERGPQSSGRTGRGGGGVHARVRRAGPRTLVAGFTAPAAGLAYHSLRWQVLSSSRAAGCPGAAGRCLARFPAPAPGYTRLHVPRLVGRVSPGPIVYGGPASRHEVALTFDDGPWNDPPTIDFIDELHRLGAPATFFEIGNQISQFDPGGRIERAMLAEGDMIGNHTWTHPQMASLSPAAQASELTLTNHAIHAATGFTPCLWRPPYGDVTSALESLAGGLGLRTIYWNDDPRDWSLPGMGSIVSTALGEARNGSIVELHFGGGPRTETLRAIPLIVRGLQARGYRLVNLAQMLGVRELWR